MEPLEIQRSTSGPMVPTQSGQMLSAMLEPTLIHRRKHLQPFQLSLLSCYHTSLKRYIPSKRSSKLLLRINCLCLVVRASCPLSMLLNISRQFKNVRKV